MSRTPNVKYITLGRSLVAIFDLQSRPDTLGPLRICHREAPVRSWASFPAAILLRSSDPSFYDEDVGIGTTAPISAEVTGFRPVGSPDPDGLLNLSPEKGPLRPVVCRGRDAEAMRKLCEAGIDMPFRATKCSEEAPEAKQQRR